MSRTGVLSGANMRGGHYGGEAGLDNDVGSHS